MPAREIPACAGVTVAAAQAQIKPDADWLSWPAGRRLGCPQLARKQTPLQREAMSAFHPFLLFWNSGHQAGQTIAAKDKSKKTRAESLV